MRRRRAKLKEIPVTDILYTLKQMAMKNGLFPDKHKIPDLYRAFYQTVQQSGRAAETMVMARYGLRHPGDVVGHTPLALRLLRRGRIDILPTRRPGREKMRPLLQDRKQN